MQTSDNKPVHIDISLWGKDHWSTLAYIEACCVDKHGYLDNRRMRCNASVHPQYVWHEFHNDDGYPTRLNDGTDVHKHDDWSCIEDMVAVGLVVMEKENCKNTVKVELTDKGIQLAHQLRAHKIRGGSFATFKAILWA